MTQMLTLRTGRWENSSARNKQLHTCSHTQNERQVLRDLETHGETILVNF